MPPSPSPEPQQSAVDPAGSLPEVVASVDADELWEAVFALHLVQAIEDHLRREKDREGKRPQERQKTDQ